MSKPPSIKFIYTDDPHAYYVNGVKAPGASTTAKIPADTFLLEKWVGRQILIGAALDRNICENVAVDPDNDTKVNGLVEEAKKVAGAHRKADRGTQAHKALQLTLLGREDELLTAQQHADAKVLRRTLDRYQLEPTEYVERFVYYPDAGLCGRFDAILKDRHGNRVMSDLKTGLNAIRYPHTTAVQLAFYRNAPWMSSVVAVDRNQTTVIDWEPMPDCDPEIGYVIQLEVDAEVGTLYTLNIEHGWAGAELALDIREWRKQFNWGDDLAQLVTPPDHGQITWRQLIEDAQTLTELRLIYATARDKGALTPQLKGMFMQRSQQLSQES
jgi:hypothetical protein